MITTIAVLASEDAIMTQFLIVWTVNISKNALRN
jgi:hypothetical protein